MASMWRFLTVPSATHEQGWWPTPRWALRRLAMYAIAALSGALLFVLCTALLALFFPKTPTATVSVFGYIDLFKLIALALGLFILLFRLSGVAKKANVKAQIGFTVISTAAPTVIILAALMLISS